MCAKDILIKCNVYDYLNCLIFFPNSLPVLEIGPQPALFLPYKNIHLLLHVSSEKSGLISVVNFNKICLSS
jgi:hypothetical protein